MRINIQKNGGYWEGMDKDIASYKHNCPICVQMNNSKYLKPPFKLILSSNHERYLTDIWELLPKITSITP